MTAEPRIDSRSDSSLAARVEDWNLFKNDPEFCVTAWTKRAASDTNNENRAQQEGV